MGGWSGKDLYEVVDNLQVLSEDLKETEEYCGTPQIE